MNNIMNKIEDKLMPIANFFGTQKHLLAVRDGIVAAMPFTIIGSIFLVIASPPFSEDLVTGIGFLDGFLQGWNNFAVSNQAMLIAPFDISMGIMSLYICVATAYSLSKAYEKSCVNYVVSTLCIYLLLVSPIKDGMIMIDALKSKGILLAVFIALASVELLRFVENRGWTVKLPKSVPSAVSLSFSSIFPFAFLIIVMYGLSLLCQSLTGLLIPDLFFTVFTNVIKGVDNAFVITILIGLESFLFAFGVHPTTVVGPIINPIALQNTTMNADLVAAGMQATHVYTDPFFNFYIGIGGAGATLILCFMLLRSRSKRMKDIGKMALIPSIFNINEPLIFGLPIFLNPIMIIPFTIVPMVNTAIGWAATALGLVNASFVNAPWTLPAPFAAALSAMDFRAFFLVLAMMVIDGLIYYPFMKMYERQQLKLENGKEE